MRYLCLALMSLLLATSPCILGCGASRGGSEEEAGERAGLESQEESPELKTPEEDFSAEIEAMKRLSAPDNP